MVSLVANSIRTAKTLKILRWLKARVLGGQQFGAVFNALHTAMFLGLSYVGMTIVTGWAQQIWATITLAERQ
jgi:hypothetical protein